LICLLLSRLFVMVCVRGCFETLLQGCKRVEDGITAGGGTKSHFGG
jgi:hypothetical protein